MRLKHIEVFNAIMVSGSISGAAKILNVTQPAVTQTLQHAEIQLGFALFKRIKNRLIPTREALSLYPEIEKLFSQLQSVRSLAYNLKNDADGELKIMVVPSLTRYLLPRALKLFRKKYPKISLNIHTLHSKDIIEKIALRQANLGIVYGQHNHPSLETTELASGNLVCIKKNDHQLVKQHPNEECPISSLHQQAIIRIYNKDPIGFALNELCIALDIEFQGEITVHSHQMALDLVEQGFGTAIVDIFSAASLFGKNFDIHKLTPVIPVCISAIQAKQDEETSISSYLMRCIEKTAKEILLLI